MKRAITMTALGAAAALVATSWPAGAAPAKQVIEDPVGDANFVNDQGTGDGSFGDFNQADAGTVSDLTGISLTNDAKNLTITIETEAAPPAITGIGYRVRFNPDGAGGSYCLLVEAFHPGANNALAAAEAYVRNVCEGSEAVALEVLGGTVVVPRKLDKALGKGKKLVAPQAQSFLWSGGSYPTGVAGPYADTTTVGTDYKMVDKKKKKKKR